jgi:hypothetical protein
VLKHKLCNGDGLRSLWVGIEFLVYIFYVCRSLKAVSWLKTFVAGRSSHWPGVNIGSIRVRCVTKCRWDSFLFEYFGFPQSVSFHGYSVLMLLLLKSLAN